MLVNFTPTEKAPTVTTSKAPTARPITAQGAPGSPASVSRSLGWEALGNGSNEEPRAEGPPYSPVANQPSFFDGIDTSLESIASLVPSAPSLRDQLAKVSLELSSASTQFDPKQPGKTAPALADASVQLDHVIDSIDGLSASADAKENVRHELLIKRVQLNDALTLALNVQLDATISSANGDIVAGAAPPVQVTISADPKLTLSIVGPRVRNDRAQIINASIPLAEPGQKKRTIVDWFARPLPASGTSIHSIAIHGEGLKHITRPYFTRRDAEQPFYDLADPQLRNAPTSPPALTANVQVVYREVELGVSRVVHSSSQPVQIIPPVSLTLDRNAQVIPDGTHSLNVDVHTVSEDHPQGELRLHAPSEWTIRSPQRPLRAGTETFPAALPAHPQTATLKAEAVISGTTYTEGFRAIGYGSLPRTNFYTPATLRVVPVDLKLPPENKRRIAYLPGTGDDVPAALASIGLTPTMLKVSDLTTDKLKAFDTVILGVRTYNAHPDLHGAPTQALLDFARNGGNVVVQYQTPEFTAADAPYPLTDRNERVIDETAPVTLLTAGSSQLKAGSDPGAAALLTTPNRITSADFNNWIEERGHGFLDTWDSHYTALTETRDPGAPAEHIQPQAPQRGGLITVQLGKGRWTYVAFALYRQLPEAVPGAFRLFVNLLNP